MAAGRIGSSAALIAGLTVASRLAGFARVLVFAWAVGYTSLGNMYQTANTAPNIVFEIVAGGALAALVVPVLAAPIARKDAASVASAASAMLTWTLLILVPVAVLVAVFAEPIVGLMSARAPADEVAVGARMLVVFAPQLPLYGAGVVLTGVLQAHRRFAWPALAPLLSSLTVIGAYTVFGLMDAASRASRAGELVLSVGTTLGVVVLTGCLVPPVLRLGVRLRPAVSFAEQAGRQVKSLAGAGVVTVGMQQLAMLVVIYLGNPPAPDGTLVAYTVATTLYLLPWAVLAVPLATAVYPSLADAVATEGKVRYDSLLSATARGVVLLSGLGAAALFAMADPLARFMTGLSEQGYPPGSLAGALRWMAPGLLGYGLFALLSRALYARGDNMRAAIATVAGWGTVMITTMLLAGAWSDGERVLALAAGNTAGMCVLGLALIVIVVARAGRGALSGLWRVGGVTLLAALAAAAAGVWAGRFLDGWNPIVAGVIGGLVVLVVYGAVTVPLDRHDVRPVVDRFVRRLRRG
ncbi:membrane protein [Actinorhabdospora filicis]|uniref:Membrane protein n=1 Tax=Actinorhabdospora filicis TaxID=1785913 RepID=A0A9W6SNT9_9ACTN|nr:lipid II flippase MurJ [Actinorhabdospora filicis]GLZ79317.1 membrane protein [Actinorhabdospora filicis]